MGGCPKRWEWLGRQDPQQATVGLCLSTLCGAGSGQVEWPTGVVNPWPGKDCAAQSPSLARYRRSTMAQGITRRGLTMSDSVGEAPPKMLAVGADGGGVAATAQTPAGRLMGTLIRFAESGDWGRAQTVLRFRGRALLTSSSAAALAFDRPALLIFMRNQKGRARNGG